MTAKSFVQQSRTMLEMIKIEHTLFALPFAFLGMLLAAGGWPPWRSVGWIVVAMVGARSAAMAFNRLVDRRIDAANPRTAGRALPAGLVSPAAVTLFVLVSSGLVGISAALHALTLSLLALLPRVYPGPPGLGTPYWVGWAGCLLLICYQHWVVRPGDLSRLNAAFFTANGALSVWLFAATALDILRS